MKLEDENALSFAELRERNHFLETLINRTPSILYIYDLVEKKNVYVNEGVQRFSGYSAQEVQNLGSKLFPLLMHPDDLKNYIREMLPKYATAKDGEQLTSQYRMKHKDGTWRWAKVSESIYSRMPDGTPQQIFGMMEDITERKKIEEKLQEKESSLSNIIRNSPDLIMLNDSKGRVTYISPQVETVIGHKGDIFKGADFSGKYIHPDDLELVLKNFNRVIKGEDLIDFEYRFYSEKGQLQWLNHTARAIKQDGKVISIQSNVRNITKRRKMEKALEGSENYLRNILNNIGEPVFVKDEQSRILLANDSFCQLFALDRDDIIGKTLAEELPPEEIESYLSIDKQVMETGKESINEESFSVIGKQPKIISTRKSRFIDNNGNKFLICTSHDITKSKQAEKALQESESQKNAILNGITSNVALVDKDLNILWINKAGADSVNKAPAEIRGRTCHYLWADPDKPCDNCPTLKAFQTKKSEKVVMHTPDDRYWEESGEPVFDANGNVIAVVEIALDVTERKKVEMALASEKERLAITLQSIGDGVVTTDTNGKIVTLNKVAEELTGWQSGEAAGHPLLEVFNVVNEITRNQCPNPASKAIEAGGVIELGDHNCLIAKDGRETLITNSVAPIHNSDSEIIGVVLVFRDMTEKYKLDETRQKAQKLESLGVLAGGIAHDFNNILTSVFGYVEMSMLKTTDKKVLHYLAESLDSIDRASALTQQLLTFSKGGAPIKKVESLFPFVQKTAEFALSGSSVLSEFQIQENLWPCNFDKNQIGQVIDNLTINAQQAMPNGGKIEFTAQNVCISENEHVSLAKGNYVKLAIKDEGIGIPKEFLSSIFDPYFTTKSKGHGLGLATCYSIVTRHDGVIEIESKLGKGSIFYLYLPAVLEAISTSLESLVEEHRGTGTFLVMDDEASIRDIMKEALESFGYTAVLKENGEDAVAFVKAEIKANRKLAGMIFDLTIPGGMGGREAIGEIRKLSLDVPAFVASGYSVDPVMANPIKYEFTASITKPFRISELSKMFEKYIK